MNQISKISVCRSLLRRNPFTRWSSKPISSSFSWVISNNQASSSNLITLTSKFHTFNHPPQKFSTPGNNFRKFSGEAAKDANFSDDYLKEELRKVREAIHDARDDIELGTLPPLDAVKIPTEKYNALKEKFGLDNGGDLPHHLQRFEKEIERLEESVHKIVIMAKYADAGGELGDVFKDWYRAFGRFIEEWSIESEDETAQDQIAMPVDDVSEVAGITNQTIRKASQFKSKGLEMEGKEKKADVADEASSDLLIEKVCSIVASMESYLQQKKFSLKKDDAVVFMDALENLFETDYITMDDYLSISLKASEMPGWQKLFISLKNNERRVAFAHKLLGTVEKSQTRK